MKKRQLKLWERSLDFYAAAVAELARKYAEVAGELERLRHAGALITRAYQGIRAERDRLLKEVRALREENRRLREENTELNATLDAVAASHNGELIKALADGVGA